MVLKCGGKEKNKVVFDFRTPQLPHL